MSLRIGWLKRKAIARMPPSYAMLLGASCVHRIGSVCLVPIAALVIAPPSFAALALLIFFELCSMALDLTILHRNMERTRLIASIKPNLTLDIEHISMLSSSSSDDDDSPPPPPPPPPPLAAWVNN